MRAGERDRSVNGDRQRHADQVVKSGPTYDVTAGLSTVFYSVTAKLCTENTGGFRGQNTRS